MKPVLRSTLAAWLLGLTFLYSPLIIYAQNTQEDYWSDTWRGWHFYEVPDAALPEKLSEKIPATPQRPAHTTPNNPAKAPELIEFERLQKTLGEYRNIAIIRPTESNVRRYMELESKIVARASYFADVAQRVAWVTAELDPSNQGRPVNAKALEIFEQTQLSQRFHSIENLSKDHVLFFFYRSDCPYCHALAPTLEAFQTHYGIKVVAISVDGGSMPGFPDARNDNGIATTLKVSQVPAIFLAQPFTGQITPIGFGVLSEAQLLERISIVSTAQSKTMLPSSTRRLALQ